MAQHDYVIDNASGATVRADINSALSAIQTLNSGTSAPSSTAAGMLWLDTTGGAPYALKVRDAGNNHWLTLASVTDPGSDGNIETSATIKGTIDSSADLSNATFPAGHIIQMQTVDTDTEYLSTSSTTYTTLSNLSLNITPKSSGSKIIIMLNGISKLGTNGGNPRTEYRFLVNSSPIEYWYGIQYLNTNAIDDEANHVHIMKIYSHGQTSSFSNLQIDFDFRRTGSNIYGDCAFNFDGLGTNYASSYAMEITV